MTDSEPQTVKPSEKQEDVLASRMGTSKEDNSVKRQVLYVSRTLHTLRHHLLIPIKGSIRQQA